MWQFSKSTSFYFVLKCIDLRSFFYKNTLYKNIEAQIGYKNKNKVKFGLYSVRNKNHKSRKMLFKNNVQ